MRNGKKCDPVGQALRLGLGRWHLLEARLEDEKQCILVLIGATPEGKKELVGFTDGAGKSAHDWRSLLLDLKRHGLEGSPPELAIADGGLGFWKAAGEVWPKTREQRCWVHKTANVLAKLPKSQQPKATRHAGDLDGGDEIVAEATFEGFIHGYELKYAKADQCLAKDRDALLVFYDFPAEHWKHLRTTNQIESTFATVRTAPFDPRAVSPTRPRLPWSSSWSRPRKMLSLPQHEIMQRNINAQTPKPDDVGHSVVVHIRKLARIFVIAAPTSGRGTKLRKFKGRRRKMTFSGRE